MRRIRTYLVVAFITLLAGISATLLVRGLLSSFSGTTEGQPVVYAPPEPPAQPKSPETVYASPCGCQQKESGAAADDALQASDKQLAPIRGGILNRKAVSLPKPPYPPIAKSARASGTVVVQIIVDERGCVASARAVSGHPLLQAASVQAAQHACFSPTRLSGQPVKVSGVVTYNFVLE